MNISYDNLLNKYVKIVNIVTILLAADDKP